LETVGEADRRFGEDTLRVMRALRIVNVCNAALIRFHPNKKSETLFDFTTTTRESIKTNAHLLEHVAKERIKEELYKVFQKGDPF